MAIITNQARLSYNGRSVLSNVTTGQILDTLSGRKTALVGTYNRDDSVTYTVNLLNGSSGPVSGVTITDNLGAYTDGTETRTPLTYTAGSAALYINGVLQTPAPTVTEGPPLVISGFTIPANGNAVLIYSARVNNFAPLGATDSIENVATVSATGITPFTLSETIAPEQTSALSITKSMNPTTVTDNGTLTYTFVIQNYGNTLADVDSDVIVNDTFTPVLSGINVMLDGNTLDEGTNYSYNTATGVFATEPGTITVAPAVYSRNPDTGEIVVTPGTATLTVSGTV